MTYFNVVENITVPQNNLNANFTLKKITLKH